jgi:hypothetical protein
MKKALIWRAAKNRDNSPCFSKNKLVIGPEMPSCRAWLVCAR